MTDIVPAPDIRLSSEFPTNADRTAGVFNAKSNSWAITSREMAADTDAAAKSAQTNAIAANERATAANLSHIAASEQADAAMGYRNTAGSHAATATTQADVATTKAGEAAASAVQASKLNLGNKSTPPTLDNQGASLLAGATYYDTTLEKWRVWTGAAWGEGVSAVAGVSSLDGQAGPLTLKTINGLAMLGAGNIETGASIYRVARTTNTALAATDKGKLIDITSGTFTQTFAAAATLGDGWWCYLRNSGTGVVTLDPNASETIDGAATKTLDPGQTVIVQCDGSALRTIPISGVGNHYVSVNTGIGYGSTNTKIRRFTTTLGSAGTAITYADNATLGASFTINESGMYAIEYSDGLDTSFSGMGVTVNSEALTTEVLNVPASTRLAVAVLSQAVGEVATDTVSCVARLAAGDVIRAHCGYLGGGLPNLTNSIPKFSIRKVGL